MALERLPGFRDFYPEPLPHTDVWSADARQYIYQSPWNLLFPMFAIIIAVSAFNLLGDGLRRAFDVRLAQLAR